MSFDAYLNNRTIKSCFWSLWNRYLQLLLFKTLKQSITPVNKKIWINLVLKKQLQTWNGGKPKCRPFLHIFFTIEIYYKTSCSNMVDQEITQQNLQQTSENSMDIEKANTSLSRETGDNQESQSCISLLLILQMNLVLSKW